MGWLAGRGRVVAVAERRQTVSPDGRSCTHFGRELSLILQIILYYKIAKAPYFLITVRQLKEPHITFLQKTTLKFRFWSTLRSFQTHTCFTTQLLSSYSKTSDCFFSLQTFSFISHAPNSSAINLPSPSTEQTTKR